MMDDVTLVSGEVDLPADAYEQYFRKLLDIWRDRCHTINRRLAGTNLVNKDTEEFMDVCKAENLEPTDQVQVWKMIPKSDIFSSSAYEASLSNESLCGRFYPCVLDGGRHPHVTFPYIISLQVISNNAPAIAVCELSVRASESERNSWLCLTAFPNLLRILKKMDLTKSAVKTHSLVDSGSFIKTYRRIKAEFGRQIVAEWSERTDPLKYVYEDCCIAAYLSEVYKSRQKDVVFCDVGCGNGLLVHLLNKLNFNGFGFDLRKRRIWSRFKDADLREFTLNPEEDFILNTNLFIGNHNDELTPWIPIIAARKRCDFFLLPCCPYSFYGAFTTKSKNGDCNSIYTSYLEFLLNLCTKLGFSVREDRLRIPSTKRRCFVCSVPPDGLPLDVETIIQGFIGGKNKTFLARSKSIQVLNISKIPKEIQEQLVKKIFLHLFSKTDEKLTGWCRGGMASLSELATVLDDEEKSLLKNSCGGLKTFIKNHHQIFKVIKGEVVIRDWATDCVIKRNRKTKQCWFHLNHPQGCPLSDDLCTFRH